MNSIIQQIRRHFRVSVFLLAMAYAGRTEGSPGQVPCHQAGHTFYFAQSAQTAEIVAEFGNAALFIDSFPAPITDQITGAVAQANPYAVAQANPYAVPQANLQILGDPERAMEDAETAQAQAVADAAAEVAAAQAAASAQVAAQVAQGVPTNPDAAAAEAAVEAEAQAQARRP